MDFLIHAVWERRGTNDCRLLPGIKMLRNGTVGGDIFYGRLEKVPFVGERSRCGKWNSLQVSDSNSFLSIEIAFLRFSSAMTVGSVKTALRRA